MEEWTAEELSESIQNLIQLSDIVGNDENLHDIERSDEGNLVLQTPEFAQQMSMALQYRTLKEQAHSKCLVSGAIATCTKAVQIIEGEQASKVVNSVNNTAIIQNQTALCHLSTTIIPVFSQPTMCCFYQQYKVCNPKIVNGSWFMYDNTFLVGTSSELRALYALMKDQAFMICEHGSGIIRAVTTGQEDKISVMNDNIASD